MEERKLKVGFIGSGEIAATHAECAAKCANVKIVMTMDTNAALAKDLGEKYGAGYTDNVDELLKNKEVEAVYIATPHYLHAPLAIKAAKAGKHIMVEKPIATTLKDADAIIEECRKQNVRLSVCFVLRYLLHVLKAKELVEKGVIGKIIAIKVSSAGDKPESYWTGGYSGRAKTDWRMLKEKSGGGILIMNTSHNIDYIRFITGLEVKRVYSEYKTLATSTKVEVEDTLFATLLFDNDAIGEITSSSCFRVMGKVTGLEDRIFGTEGQIILGNPLKVYTARGIYGLEGNELNEIKLDSDWSCRQKYIEKFAEAILCGKEPPITGHDGRKCLEIVNAIYKAGETQKPVTLPFNQ